MITNLVLTPAMLLMSFLFCPHPNEFLIDGGIGYRSAKFDWNIGGLDHEPDVLSELVWKDLRMIDLFLEGDWKTPFGGYLKANGELGIIVHGENRDSDYAGNHRSFEFARSLSKSNRGFFGDVSGAIGRHFMLRVFPLTFYPMIGYSAHRQYLCIHDGKRVIVDEPQDPPIPIPDLASSYTATLHGPWLGLDASLRLSRFVYLRGGGEYHWAAYRGHGNWNLRGDLPRGFDQNSHAKGQTLFASLEIGVGYFWSIGLTGRYQHWHAHKGVDQGTVLIPWDTSFFAIEYEQPFNEANLQSYSILLSATARF